jgi:hypothetical protein
VNGGQRLADVGNDAGVAYETGWVTSDNANLAPTNGSLACGAKYATWTLTLLSCGGRTELIDGPVVPTGAGWLDQRGVSASRVECGRAVREHSAGVQVAPSPECLREST